MGFAGVHVNHCLAAEPKPGVYQQMYANGRLKSTVTIMHNPGTCDYMAMTGLGDATYISMEAMDENGIEIEEYAVKYNPDATSLYGFTINASNLRKCEQADWFHVETNKKNTAAFNFSEDGKVIVSGAGSLYDGEYHFSPRSEAQANYALMTYAYESTKMPSISYEGMKMKRSYNIFHFVKAPWLVNMQIKDGNEQGQDVLLDNGFHIAMEYKNQGNSVYKPFFMSDNYVEWAENGLAQLVTDVNGDTSSLYMHQYLAKNYPELTANNNIKLIAVDFYGGEGENAVFTRAYKVEKFVDGESLLAAEATHSDNGVMRVQQYIGNKSIAGEEVRLRQQPNTNCDVLGYFMNNERIYVYGYANVDYTAPLPNGWAYVKRANGQAGYVAAQFVKR